jgi:amino acid transporter
MIQRVQTIYFILSIICLMFVTFGSKIYQFDVSEGYFVFNSYGVQKFNVDNELIQYSSFPYYISSIALLLLIVIAIFSYKNLNRQLRLGRIILLIYFIILITLMFTSFLGVELTGEEINSKKSGLGFYLFVIGFSFIFLANTGIKRDIKLLESLNRLR